jgi:glycosyltransferase involved in cell wall biosynthesis
MPLTSVIIPTVDRASDLMRALHSVFAQSFRDFEVVVVGDDASAEVIEQVAWEERRHSNLRFINLLARSHDYGTTPRNRALEQTDSDFVSYLDDDCYYFPNHLERCHALASSGCDLVITDSLLQDREGRFGFRWGRQRVIKGGVDTSEIFHHRRLLQRVGPWRSGLYEPDFDLVNRFLQSGVRPEYTRTVTVCYRWGALSFAEVAGFMRRIMTEEELESTYTFL